MKIRTLSPVHIGTGEINKSIFYTMREGYLCKLNDADFFMGLTPEDLLDADMLNSLSQKNTPRKTFENRFSKQNLSGVRAEYKLVDNRKSENKNGLVDEQIKNMDMPYIPGSSIKGMIMNALLYCFLKEHKDVFFEGFNKAAENDKKMKVDEAKLLSFVWKKDYKTIDKFLHKFSSCILCEDVCFETMEMYSSKRIGANRKTNKSGELPMNSKECISIGSIETTPLFAIDETKKKVLFHDENDVEFSKFITYLDKQKILIYLKNFNDELLEMELDRIRGLYSKYPQISDFLNDLKSGRPDRLIVKIGNGTNYWSKGISLLFKKYKEPLYLKYFDNFFIPIKNREFIKKSKFIKKEKMPKTSIILENKEYVYLPGYLEISDD